MQSELFDQSADRPKHPCTPPSITPGGRRSGRPAKRTSRSMRLGQERARFSKPDSRETLKSGRVVYQQRQASCRAHCHARSLASQLCIPFRAEHDFCPGDSPLWAMRKQDQGIEATASLVSSATRHYFFLPSGPFLWWYGGRPRPILATWQEKTRTRECYQRHETTGKATTRCIPHPSNHWLL